MKIRPTLWRKNWESWEFIKMHIPVLLNESLEYLDPRPGDIILDGTIGGGGHAEKILEKIGEKGKLVGLDQDEKSLEFLKSKVQNRKSWPNAILINENFRNLDKALESRGIEKLNGAIFDIGLSSSQLEESGRGFSFQKDEPLLMTMRAIIGPDDLTAMDIVNKRNEKELEEIIRNFGEERFSKRIAENIVKRRRVKLIGTTFDLVDVIREAVPAQYRNNRRINCATRTFQALRIAVNDELGALKEGMEKAWRFLDKGGRLAVISFHSLEDRIVKNYFKEKKASGEGKILTKKPVVPAREEIKSNPRSRSAKLRAIEKN